MALPCRGRRHRIRAHQHIVVPAVVVSFKLDDLRPASVATRQPQRRHHRFGAGVGETHAFGVWNQAAQQFSDFDFDFGSGGKMSSIGSRLGDCARDLRICVPQWQRSKTHHPVDVLVSIHVVEPRAVSPLHEQRVFAIVERSARRGAATLDQQVQAPLVELSRFFGAQGQILDPSEARAHILSNGEVVRLKAAPIQNRYETSSSARTKNSTPSSGRHRSASPPPAGSKHKYR